MALAVLALLSCAPETDPDTDVVTAGDVFVVLETEDYEGDVFGMGILGELVLVDGCVGLGQGDDGVVVLFPPDTNVSGENEDLVIEVGGKDFRLGDTINGGTRLNEGARAPLTSFGDLDKTAPSSCRDRQAVPVDPNG